MSDESQRALERRALEGDQGAEERLFRELERRGELAAFDAEIEKSLARVQGEGRGFRPFPELTAEEGADARRSYVTYRNRMFQSDHARLAPYDVALALEVGHEGVVARALEGALPSTFVAVVVVTDDLVFGIGRADATRIGEIESGLKSLGESALAGLDVRRVSRIVARCWLKWLRGPRGLSLTQGQLDVWQQTAEHLRRRPGVFLGNASTAASPASASPSVPLVLLAAAAFTGRALESGADCVRVERSALDLTVVDDGEGISVAEHPRLRRPRLETLLLPEVEGLGVFGSLFRRVEVETVSEGRGYRQQFERGIPLYNVEDFRPTWPNGSRVRLKFDPEIPMEDLSFASLSDRLLELAAMHPGQTVQVKDSVTSNATTLLCEAGLLDLLVQRTGVEPESIRRVTSVQQAHDEALAFEVAVGLTDRREPFVVAFANERRHEGVYVHALLSTAREELGGDARGIVGAVSVRLRNLYQRDSLLEARHLDFRPPWDVERREVVAVVADLTRRALDALPR